MKSIRNNKFLFLICLIHFLSFSCQHITQRNVNENTNLSTDRWVEIDLQFFNPDALQVSVDSLVENIAPLFCNVKGEKGMTICYGWLTDIITMYTGNLDQELPIRSRKILKQWEHHTYRDVKKMVSLIKAGMKAKGYADFRVGPMVVGYGRFNFPVSEDLYDFEGIWSLLHPELYSYGPGINEYDMPDLRMNMPLNKDNEVYAAFPQGIKKGMMFSDFFGKQWGEIANDMDWDLILLRDGIPGELTGKSEKWLTECLALFRNIKQNSPNTFLMGYSGGKFPFSAALGYDYRTALFADGFIDAWIVQTWGGAWQDWWKSYSAGWTHQVTNLLINGLLVEQSNIKRQKPCKFYALIEGADGYEPWNTVKNFPGKLKWGIWAFNTATIITPSGPKTNGGNYIAWISDRYGKLLDKKEFKHIITELNAAETVARGIEITLSGAALLPNQDIISHGILPAEYNMNHFLDDQSAFLMKWGFPLTSVTIPEWLSDSVSPFIFTNASGLKDANLFSKMKHGGVFMANPMHMPDALLDSLGIRKDTTKLYPTQFYPLLFHQNLIQAEHKEHLARLLTFPSVAAITAEPLITTRGQLLASEKNGKFFYNPTTRLNTIDIIYGAQLGSMGYFTALAEAFNRRLFKLNGIMLEGITIQSPLTLSYWKSSGKIFFLIGNIETGMVGESRFPRTIILVLKKELNITSLLESGTAKRFKGIEKEGLIKFKLVIPDESCLVLEEEKNH